MRLTDREEIKAAWLAEQERLRLEAEAQEVVHQEVQNLRVEVEEIKVRLPS